MTTETTQSLQLTRIIKARRERVFHAWTSPELLRQWSAPEGYLVRDAEVDLRVDGVYRLIMESPEGTPHVALGTYHIIQPPRRLESTWRWEGPDAAEETHLAVEFRDLDDSTAVVLTHDRFSSEAARDDHETAWASCLARLDQLFS